MDQFRKRFCFRLAGVMNFQGLYTASRLDKSHQEQRKSVISNLGEKMWVAVEVYDRPSQRFRTLAQPVRCLSSE